MIGEYGNFDTLDGMKKIVKNDKGITIKSHELKDSLDGRKRGSILKRSLRNIDVACIPTTQKIQAQLATISERLQGSPNVLKFYGISRIYNQPIKVFEWAEYGNLCEVYNEYNIDWMLKVNDNIIPLKKILLS